MSDLAPWHQALEALESRLLAAWVAGPSFRAHWTPKPEEFFLLRNQAIAKACVTLAALGPVDLGVQLVMQLASSGDLKRHWPLGESPLECVTVRDPMGDLAQWNQMRIRFALRTRLAELVSGMSPVGNLDQERKRALEAISQANAGGPAPAYSDVDLMNLAWDSVTRTDRTGSFSGHVQIDQATGGIRPGHVWVLGAPTNWGKSSWLLSVADHYLSIHSQGVLYVTCEDAPELLATRLLCRRAEIRGKAARDAKLSTGELEAATEQIKIAASRGDVPMMIDGRGRPVESLAQDIRAAVSANAIRVVLVDYLQCITTERDTQDRRSEINHISRTLTDAIKTSGAGGVLASQLTGEDIRESRDVEHAAEVVLIGRKSEDGKLSMFIKKNKTGASGFEMDLDWNHNTGAFRTKLEDEYGIDNL